MGTKFEQTSGQLKILIVDEGTEVGTVLKKELKKHDSEIFVSPKPPENLGMFNWSFFINQKESEINKLLDTDINLKNSIFICLMKKNQKRWSKKQNPK